jgi:hypothetical protein
VAFRGNRYSVPPELARAQVSVTHRLGATSIDITTASGIVIARHTLATPGAGGTIRDTGHVAALEPAVLAAHTTPHHTDASNASHPARAARTAAAALRAAATATDHPAASEDVDLAAYAAAAEGRSTLR